MSEVCPEIAVLRAFSEGGSEERRDRALAAHVEGCGKCARLVDLARREEAALRGALPAEPPRDLLERTLRALDGEGKVARPAKRPDSGRRRTRSLERPRPVFAALLAAAVVLAGICLAYQLTVERGEAPDEQASAPSSPEEKQRVAPPPATSSTGARKENPPPRRDPVEETPSETVAPERSDAAPFRKDPEKTEPAPGTNEPVPHPKNDEETQPGKPTTEGKPKPEEAPALAVVRSGKLVLGGKALGVGDGLPAGTAVEAAQATEIEAPGAVKVSLSSRSKLTVREGERGEVVLVVSTGRAFVRTAGEKRYSVASDDVRATPLGTAFVFAVEGGRTRVSTIEGSVRCAVERTAHALDVRAGFEADLSKGKAPEAPRPLDAGKALAWLPAATRPAKLPPVPRVLRSFTFDDGNEGFTKGTRKEGGARGSAGALAGVKAESDYAVVVELDQTGTSVLAIDPDLWIEATVRVDRASEVVLQVWDAERKENLSWHSQVEAGRWTTVAAPLAEFRDSAGKPRKTALGVGDRATCFSVFAGKPGEKVELLVDDVRFSLEK